MTASSTSLAGSRRRRDVASVVPATGGGGGGGGGSPAPRGVSTRAHAARPRRPSSLDSLGDGGEPGERTPPANDARAHPPPRGRRSVQSFETTTRGWWTGTCRSGSRRREISRRRIPGTSPFHFNAPQGTDEELASRRAARRSSSADIIRFTYPSPAAYTPARYPAVPASYVSPRVARDAIARRRHRPSRSVPSRRRRRRHAERRGTELDSRNRARVGGSGVGSRVTITTARGRALGGSNRESPLGRVPEETIHGNDGKGRERREPRRRREIRTTGKKRSRIFVRGGRRIPCLARRDGAPRERRFRRIHDGKRRRGDGVEDAAPAAPPLFGTIRRKTPRPKPPGVPVSTRAPRKRPRRGRSDDTAEKRERRSSDPYARARTPAGGVFATERKPVAVSEARCTPLPMLGESSEDAGTTTSATPRMATAAPTTREIVLPAYPVRPARHQGFGRVRVWTGNGATVGVSAARWHARGVYSTTRRRRDARGGARGVLRSSPAPASAANADADADAGIQTARGTRPAAAGRTFHSPMLPGAARRGDRATRRRVDSRERRATGFESAPASSAPSAASLLFGPARVSRTLVRVFPRSWAARAPRVFSRVDAVVRAMTADTAIGYRTVRGRGRVAERRIVSTTNSAAPRIDFAVAGSKRAQVGRGHQACVSRAFPTSLAAALAAPAVLQRLLSGTSASASRRLGRICDAAFNAIAAGAAWRCGGVRDSSRGRGRERRGGDRGERRVVRRRRAVGSRAERPTSPRTTLRRIKNSRARRGTTRRRRAHAAALRRRGGGVPRAPRERCPTRAMGRATRRAATRRGVPASNPPTRRRSRARTLVHVERVYPTCGKRRDARTDASSRAATPRRRAPPASGRRIAPPS